MTISTNSASYEADSNRVRQGDEWTFMVYLDGDNNLEGAAVNDFLEMSSVGSNDEVNIVVQFDRIPGFSTSYGNWTDTRRGLVALGDVPNLGWGTSIGEANMGDPNTLINFTNWAMTSYPADNYALVIWDHGGGWREQVSSPKGAAWDDTDGGDYLENREVGDALAALPHIDLFGYDACVMGMLETAHQVKDEASVLVGSQESEPGDGWPFDTLLGDLTTHPTWTATQLGTAIVQRYGESYGGRYTQSAIDLGSVDNLSAAVSQLASEIVNDATSIDYSRLQSHRENTAFFGYSSDNFRDLGTFLADVASDSYLTASIGTAAQTALNAYNAAILENHSHPREGGTGLSIYFQPGGESPDSEYNSSIIDFAADTQWDEFLAEWQQLLSNDSEPNDILVNAIDSYLSPTYPGTFSDSGTIGNNTNIAPTSDVDLIRLDANGGDRLLIDIDAAISSSSLDSIVRVFDPSGREIVTSDDNPAPGEVRSLDSYIDIVVPSDGTYYIGVSGYNNVDYAPTIAGSGTGYSTGEYDITVELRPDGEPNDTLVEAIDSGLRTYKSGYFRMSGEISDNPAVSPNSDVDLVRLEAFAGDRLAIDTDGSLDSVLRLFDDQGNELAFSDDDAAPGDPDNDPISDSYIDFFVPADGVYYVGVSGYRNFEYDPTVAGSGSGSSTGEYRLALAHIPSSQDGFDESNDIIAEAIDTGLTDPGSFYGYSVLGNNPNITPKFDVDLFEFQLDAGQSVTIDIDAEPIGSNADTILQIFDPLGNSLALSDDNPAPNEEGSYDSYLHFTATESGTYYAGVSSYDNTGYNPIDGSPGSIFDSSYLDGMGEYAIEMNISSNDRSIFGTYDPEILTGTTEPDAIYGYEEADTLYGRGNRDILYGGDANDKLYGGAGADTLYGQQDNDILLGQNGNDELYGGRGDDALHGNAGNDRLFGLESIDRLYGGQGNDELNGGSGNDVLMGVESNTVTPGRGEVDILTGGMETDRFILGDANRAYYDDGILENTGTADYALITDFRIAESDKIQLQGVASHYILSVSGTDTNIYLDTSGQDELIGTIVGVTGLTLTTRYFRFV